jgi:hypothetical protein
MITERGPTGVSDKEPGMSPLMTEDLLSRIKEALERATPGPYIAKPGGLPWIWDLYAWDMAQDRPRIILSTNSHEGREEALIEYLVLLSPENVRALIGEVERLNGKHDGLVGALEELRAAAERDYGSPKITLRLAQAILGAEIALKDEAPSWRTRAIAAEREVERLREALEKGAEWFEEYADHHQGKGALDKASRNLERANYLRRARQSLQGTGEANPNPQQGKTL